MLNIFQLQMYCTSSHKFAQHLAPLGPDPGCYRNINNIGLAMPGTHRHKTIAGDTAFSVTQGPLPCKTSSLSEEGKLRGSANTDSAGKVEKEQWPHRVE